MFHLIIVEHGTIEYLQYLSRTLRKTTDFNLHSYKACLENREI